MHTPRILIVGGGIGGLTAAIALQRLGVEVEVAERAPSYAPVGAGITIQPNARAVLVALGVDFDPDDIYELGQVAMLAADGRPLVSGAPVVERREHRPIAIRRADLHRTLLAACGEDRVRLGCELVSLRADPSGVEVELSLGDRVERGRWDLVIGADGLHSAVRRAILSPAECEPRYSGQTCWRVQLDAPELVPEVATERWGLGRRIGVVPLSRGGIYAFLVLSAPAGTPGPGTATIAHLRERFADVDDNVAAIFDHAERGDAVIHHGDLCDLATLSYGRGRVVLLGDAAHAMTPNLGQGACMAIEDAGELACCWADRNGELDGLVEALADRRHERVEAIHRVSWRFGQVAHWQRPLLRWLRDALLRSTPSSVSERKIEKVWAPGFEIAARLRNLELARAA
jgi:2-polyprenyl-6-methoxyphenol hydroxylase-like FAD-dependent oxidoreductase